MLGFGQKISQLTQSSFGRVVNGKSQKIAFSAKLVAGKPSNGSLSYICQWLQQVVEINDNTRICATHQFHA